MKSENRDFLKNNFYQQFLSAINTPTYSLAKYLNPILSPVTTNEFNDFAEEVVNCG